MADTTNSLETLSTFFSEPPEGFSVALDAKECGALISFLTSLVPPQLMAELKRGGHPVSDIVRRITTGVIGSIDPELDPTTGPVLLAMLSDADLDWYAQLCVNTACPPARSDMSDWAEIRATMQENMDATLQEVRSFRTEKGITTGPTTLAGVVEPLLGEVNVSALTSTQRQRFVVAAQHCAAVMGQIDPHVGMDLRAAIIHALAQDRASQDVHVDLPPVLKNVSLEAAAAEARAGSVPESPTEDDLRGPDGEGQLLQFHLRVPASVDMDDVKETVIAAVNQSIAAHAPGGVQSKAPSGTLLN